MDAHFDRKRQFLAHLKRLGPKARTDSFVNEAIETGGSYIFPCEKGGWASHMVEINLHGISASGASKEEAQRNRMRMARCAVPYSAQTEAAFA